MRLFAASYWWLNSFGVEELLVLSQIAVVLMGVAASIANAAEPMSLFHIDLDDCDDIAVDAHSIYLACHSTRTPGGAPSTPPNMDGYAAKLDRRTGKILYLTRLGGEGLDIATRVILGPEGIAYVTGFTGSRDFPTTSDALQRVYGGGDSDAFLAKLDPDGRIVYSSYIGGSQADQGNGIALLPNGEILIAGSTWSDDFPYAKASFGPRGKGDAFVARFKPGDSSIHSSIVFGGSGAEKLTGIAVMNGTVFATGYTESADFPVERAFQSRLSGSSDAFLAALPEGLGSMSFSTFLGGSGADSSWGVAVDSSGNPVVAGITESDDLRTTTGDPQRQRAGRADAFVMKLDASGQRQLFSTYYGGTGMDHAGYDGQNVAVNHKGGIWMVGLTNSRDLVVPDGYHRSYGGGEQDGFLIGYSPKGKLCYGTYNGGTARYLMEGVALADNETMVYAAGVVIRPVEPNSPKPDSNEKYGSFVVAVKVSRGCR